MGLGSGRRHASDQQEDIKIARELCYPRAVIERLQNEPDPCKRQRILRIDRETIK